MNENRNSFKGSIGFVLAAAGSAVGLGNIWRFPYLAAKDGGGLFLVIYIVLALTFGFTLLTTEIAIGRKTKQSPLTAYSKLKSKWKPLGIIACIVPIMILPYYVTIGGWVLKYLLVYITGNGLFSCSSTKRIDTIKPEPTDNAPIVYSNKTSLISMPM
jgi:NSS family neurotransmitter:Na+ symporter